MFCEAYYVFSIGNIKPIFSFEYPKCFKTMTKGVCNANETRAPDYTQILGIIFGMITLGYVGDRIGREPPLHLHPVCVEPVLLPGAGHSPQLTCLHASLVAMQTPMLPPLAQTWMAWHVHKCQCVPGLACLQCSYLAFTSSPVSCGWQASGDP